MIERAVDYALSLASKKQGFMQKPGEVMGLLCFAHPFLDGNGRSILLFYMELSYRAVCHRLGQHTQGRLSPGPGR